MNQLGLQGKSFAFLIDFKAEKPQLFDLKKSSNEIFWQVPMHTNCKPKKNNTSIKKWQILPVSLKRYEAGYNIIHQHILNGDTYLLNYTQPTTIDTNLQPEDIFSISNAPYKIFLKNRFVCFSPETFIKIRNGKIYSSPMKGTIDANVKNAKKIILNDSKELAEHNTIVDLIRNDLSLVAENVVVDKFRFIDHIRTNQRDLLQVSSVISGNLPKDYQRNIGNIIFTLLPAGSVTGAPKKKTVEIINKVEKYNRGYYTGIFGIFDGKNLDSCVLIRYIEIEENKLVYKSGGGITHLSNVASEYDEMIKKVYVPVT